MKLFATVLISLLPLTTLGVDFGPFTITGFAKIEASQASNQCTNCQLNANEYIPRRTAPRAVSYSPSRESIAVVRAVIPVSLLLPIKRRYQMR